MLLRVPRERHQALLLHSEVPKEGLATVCGDVPSQGQPPLVIDAVPRRRLCRESRQSRTKSASSTCRASTPDSKPLTTPLAMAEPGPKPSTGRSAPARPGRARLALAKSGPKPAPARSGKDLRASTPASEVIVVVKKTLDDMRDSKTTDPDWKDLLAWMRAIHAGHRVKCDGAGVCAEVCFSSAGERNYRQGVRPQTLGACECHARHSRLARLQVAG